MSNGLLDNLVEYFKCDEVSGNRIGVHAGTICTEVGSVASATGKDGLGISPGTDIANRLEGPTGAPFNFGDESFSLATWQAFEAGSQTANHPIVAKWNASGAPDIDDSWLLWFRTTNDQWRMSISSDGTSEQTIVETTTFPATPFGFVFIAAGYDADNNEIWIKHNANARITAAHIGGAFSGSNALLTLAWFDGEGAGKVMGSNDIDEIGIWNKFLTDTDLVNLYAGGTGLFFDSFDSEFADVGAASLTAQAYYYGRP